MADAFKTQSWSLKVPDLWEVDDSEEPVHFYAGGADEAALSVEASYNDSDLTMEEMRNLIQAHSPDGTLFTEVRLGDFTGYTVSYTHWDDKGEAAWRVWCVFCRDLYLLITYYCILRRRGKDDATADDMLRTLSCFRPAQTTPKTKTGTLKQTLQRRPSRT